MSDQTPVSTITIHNPVSCHYECIESVIHYLPQILGARYETEIRANLACISLVLNIVPEPGFIKYITIYRNQMISRYGFADIIINPVADVGYNQKPDINQIVQPLEPGEIRVYLTLPGCEFKKPEIFDWPNTYYILHNYQADILTPSNVFYLAPHCQAKLPNNYFIPDILPFSIKSVSYPDRPQQVPITDGAWILIQGRLTRRVPALIKLIMKYTISTSSFQEQKLSTHLVILTKSNDFILQSPGNIHLKINTDFWDFHQWSAKCNIIATIVSSQTHYDYYNSKLTSSISYGLAYKMRFLIDTDLYNIYSQLLLSNNVGDEQNQEQNPKNNCFTYISRQEFIQSLKAVCQHPKINL
jgi:hypothetical protein